MANIFKYASKAAYNAATDRPVNESSVSFDGGEMHYDGKNPITPLKQCDGVNIVLLDPTTKQKYGVPVAEYNAASLDPRFTIVGVMFGKILGKCIIMHKNAASRMWGQSGFHKLTPSASGSFHWTVTINGTAKSGDVSWESDAVATIVSQINAVVSGLAVNKGTYVGIAVNTYSASTFTISSDSGVEYEDLSKQCWVDGVKQTEVHRGWQNTAVGSLSLGLTSFIAANTVQYSKAGYNNSYRCGVNFAKWKSWASASGNASYVAESAVDIMKQTAFAACASGSSDAQALYAKYNGDYDAYLRAHMIKVEDVHAGGVEYIGYGRGLEQTKLLASVMTLDLDGNRVPAFPAAYYANTAYVSGDDALAAGKWQMPNNTDLGMFMEDTTYALVRSALSKIGGTALANSDYIWSVSEYGSYRAWYCLGNGGYGDSGSKRLSYSVRPLLALEI